MKRFSTLLLVLSLLNGCATHEVMNVSELEPGRLPAPDTTLNIAGLGPCTDSPDRRLRLDSRQPIHVLVHGCYGSSGQFRGLAQVLAFHGQQSACFTYDDRAKLAHSATGLSHALAQLAEQSRIPKITVIGHSQGALIARKSLTQPLPTLPSRLVDISLVTISGPFSGIESARTCGKVWLYPFTLGVMPFSCYVVTGPKWADITYSSRFIREPGVLDPQIIEYVKIDTDERDSCRRLEGERCVKDDDVFSLAEQRNSLVENDARARRVEVKAGHVEIVGDKRVAPTKLIAILQQQGVIRPTSPAQLSAFNLLLSQVYQDEGLLTYPKD